MSPRIDPVPADADDPVLREVFDVFSDADREVPLLYRTLGAAPAMLRAWTAMAWPLRHDATTDRGLRELIIMRVALVTRAPFEWVAHWPAALRHGVAEAQLEALGAWSDAEVFSPAEAATLACTDEIIIDGGASEASMTELRRHFDDGEVVELVLTASFYCCVSRTLNSLGIHPDGDPEEARATEVYAASLA